MKKLLVLSSMLLSVFVYTECEKNKENEEVIKDLYVIEIGAETEWNYMVVGRDGDYLLIEEENSLPKTIFFKPDKNSEGYPIFLDKQGFPEKAIIDEHIFLFSNFNGKKVDITIITPEGEVFNNKEIETDFSWDISSLKSAKNTEDWSDVIRWAGHVAGGVACGIGIASSPVGIGIPLVAIGCGAFVIGVITEFWPEDTEILGLSATTVGTATTLAGCVSSAGVSCVLAIASSASSITSIAIDYFDNNDMIVDGVPARISTFLNDEDIEILKGLGLTINSGYNPPDVEGFYYADNWENLNTSATYIDYSYNFFNQSLNNDIELQRASSVSNSIGFRGYISGDGNIFSIYCEERSETIDRNDNHTVNIFIASIYSGEISENGIKNLQKGFIILGKENDYNDIIMDVGDARVNYESDYFADRVNTFPFESSTKSLSLKQSDMIKE